MHEQGKVLSDAELDQLAHVDRPDLELRAAEMRELQEVVDEAHTQKKAMLEAKARVERLGTQLAEADSAVPRLQAAAQELAARAAEMRAQFRSEARTALADAQVELQRLAHDMGADADRVSRIEVRDARTGQWAPLDRARTYRMFALSFNARGGDGYKTLAAVPAARRLDVGVLDADVFLSYIEAQPKDAASGLPLLQPLDPAFYSTRRFKGPN